MANWHDLATTSHYQTAVAIKHALSAGDIEHARIGIEELIEALARSDRRALESYLIRLISRFTNLSSMTRLDLGCWVHEKAQPSTPRAEP
jgi:hypothetical protein